jgi:transcriptional regulator with XRE-family HTH domain
MTGVVRELGILLRDLREDRGLRRSKVGGRFEERGGSDSAVGRFENGIAQPRYLDEVVAIYSEVLGVPVPRLWRMAIKRYEESTNGTGA